VSECFIDILHLNVLIGL